MKNKKLIFAILIGIVIIIVTPLIVDWVIIANKVPSNISNSEWVSFLGSYVGALIGAVVTLLGISITIDHSQKENEKNLKQENEFRKMEQEIELHRMLSEVYYLISTLQTIAFGEFCEIDVVAKNFAQTFDQLGKIKNESAKLCIYSKMRAKATDNEKYDFSYVHDEIYKFYENVSKIAGEAVSSPLFGTPGFDEAFGTFVKSVGGSVSFLEKVITGYAEKIVKKDE